MRSAFLTVAVFMLIPLGAVSSQAVQPRSGDRIRLTATPNALDNRIAHVLSVRSDSLFLLIAPAETLAVALAGVTRIEVSTGRQRHTLRGAGIGALIGVASGVLSGVVTGDDPPGSGWFRQTWEEKAAFDAVFLGAMGLVIGTVVGTLKVSDRWTSVPVGTARATPSLKVGRCGAWLGVAVSIPVLFK